MGNLKAIGLSYNELSESGKTRAIKEWLVSGLTILSYSELVELLTRGVRHSYIDHNNKFLCSFCGHEYDNRIEAQYCRETKLCNVDSIMPQEIYEKYQISGCHCSIFDVLWEIDQEGIQESLSQYRFTDAGQILF